MGRNPAAKPIWFFLAAEVCVGKQSGRRNP